MGVHRFQLTAHVVDGLVELVHAIVQVALVRLARRAGANFGGHRGPQGREPQGTWLARLLAAPFSL
jgi:hypothetical protein